MARFIRGSGTGMGEFERLVRRLVVETLQDTLTQGIGGQKDEEVNFMSPPNNSPIRRRRTRTIKGRVTDPSKDRRLKRNRQPEA